jgi:hypothetical protein
MVGSVKLVIRYRHFGIACRSHPQGTLPGEPHRHTDVGTEQKCTFVDVTDRRQKGKVVILVIKTTHCTSFVSQCHGSCMISVQSDVCMWWVEDRSSVHWLQGCERMSQVFRGLYDY